MQRFIYIVIVMMITQVVVAQNVIYGLVSDKDTKEPIIGATISDVTKRRPLTVTDAEGRFVIPKNNYPQRIKITYIGYKTLTVNAVANGHYQLEAEVSKLGEVVVTAQESRGITSSSRIEKHAMEHLQPSSFSDLLELLPGGSSKDPVLNATNSIRLREASPQGANYATSSLGTSFLVDGARIATNANMQQVSGAWESAATSRDNTNAGVDMRTISTDDIESVEIVRGIPSVEYGDLTSGLVKIERRRGGHDLQARLKSDMGSKLFYLAKAFEWDKHTTLNLSADYLDSKADPRNLLNNYSRVTLSARMGHTWQRAHYDLKLSTNLDYTGSFDDEKQDPDLNKGAIDKYKQSYNRVAVSNKLELKMHRPIWLKGAELMAAASYQHDKIARTRTVSLQSMTGAVLNTEEGEYDALILPYVYDASQDVDGKPLNVFLKLNARLQIPSKKVANTLLLGADWNLDKNYGRGQVFDPERPVYPTAQIRMRSLTEKPANHTLSFYAEEKATFPVGGCQLELMAGVRAQQMLNLPADYVMHGQWYLDPRANIGFTFPRFRMFGQPSFVRLSGGVGQHTKMPTIDQLFPDPAYIDLLQLKYYNVDPSLSRINYRTYIIPGTNASLEAARNLKWEVTGDLNVGGNRLTVTYFNENMTSGFRSQTNYEAYEYNKYADDLSYELLSELCAYTHYENGSQTKKEGVELTFASKRIPRLYTRLTITGAWFRTTYRNSQLIMERPSVVVGSSRLQYVGLYHDDEGIVNEMANTNFMFDTDVPKLKLGFSVSAQCQWYTSSQHDALSSEPDAYMDAKGDIHEWTAECASDAYLKWLVRSSTNYTKSTVPFAMHLNLKITKKLLNDRLNVAMFCNRIWDYSPDYESYGKLIRRHTKPYFGLEMNVKI
ncbi:TonB-dependent receptor [Prevotella sp. MA2016]|uniref:TonB-dependent receptor n=1 Tax=Prevotella sp. MA2016 TaxID=1408310 RepID=UPI001E463EAF|nr:TonB-dependent receptor [Prevotella sp. MA2016]